MDWNIIHIDETDSTNRYVRTLDSNDEVCVWTDYQTAGRGCGSNSWESERGQNLLFSVLLHPKYVLAASQFLLSLANALALKETLDEYLTEIKIKWPNDIYWRDRKICGTLIETTLQSGHIKDCIFGTGMNINQQVFLSDAPNPVSISQIVGHPIDRQEVLEKVIAHTAKYMEMVQAGLWDDIRTQYRHHLYRRGETHRYRFTDGSERDCKLLNVTDDGRLELQAEDHEIYRLAFKEVQFIVTPL